MKHIIIICIFISSLFAHKLNLFLDQEQNSVYVSAYFASGSPCQNCLLTVFANNKKILEDKTTVKGEFIFDIGDFSKVKVSVDAGGGHIVSDELSMKKMKQTHEYNVEYKKLLKENNQLKAKVKLLEQKVNENEILKIILALGILFFIFYGLKRIKK